MLRTPSPASRTPASTAYFLSRLDRRSTRGGGGTDRKAYSLLGRGGSVGGGAGTGAEVGAGTSIDVGARVGIEDEVDREVGAGIEIREGI